MSLWKNNVDKIYKRFCAIKHNKKGLTLINTVHNVLVDYIAVPDVTKSRIPNLYRKHSSVICLKGDKCINFTWIVIRISKVNK